MTAAETKNDAPTMTIGQAARAAGVGVQTLHYYERRGLIRPKRRAASGYRDYDQETVAIVRAIRRAQSLGFTLGEILDLLRLQRTRSAQPKVVRTATAKIDEIDEKIRALQSMRDALAELTEKCRCGGDLSKCEILTRLATI